MRRRKKEKADQNRHHFVKETAKRVAEWPEVSRLQVALNAFNAKMLPHLGRAHWRTHAAHWAADCGGLLKETLYAIVQMRAAARAHRKAFKPGDRPTHVDRFVSFYASDCCVRIM